MMNLIEKSSEAYRLLVEIQSLLKEQGEFNWIRGIEAAINELIFDDGTIDVSGFDTAKSIYKTMNEGGRGFAEYFIWLDNEDQRIAANKHLDDQRTALWNVFNLQ